MQSDIPISAAPELSRGWLLQVLLSQATRAQATAVGPQAVQQHPRRDILPLALVIEQQYMQACGCHFPLPLPAFTTFLDELHQRLGGTFRVVSADAARLEFCAEPCRWQGMTSHQPALCGLMVTLYAALAAHNFGYACARLLPAALPGQGACRLALTLIPGGDTAGGTVITREEVEAARRLSVEPATEAGETVPAHTRQELAQRLCHAQQMARQAAQERELLASMQQHFLANVTHELRTPLTSIEGYLSLLADGTFGGLQPEQLDALAVVLRNVDRFKHMVEELLDFSTLERGQYLLESTLLDLAGIMHDALQRVRTEAEAHGVTVTAEIPSTLGPVLGNAEKLTQVVEHLLGNAVKFSEPGTQVRLVGFQYEGYCYLEVCDHGIGMSQEQLARAFLPFVQGEMTLMRRHEGLGMGLTLVHNLVAMHGGDIGITSAPGDGTDVLVRLPVHEERAHVRNVRAPGEALPLPPG